MVHLVGFYYKNYTSFYAKYFLYPKITFQLQVWKKINSYIMIFCLVSDAVLCNHRYVWCAAE